MASKFELEKRLEFRREALEQARNAYIALLSGGVKSYAIGSRNLTKLDIPQLEDSIARLEKEVEQMEKVLSGGRPRKAVGVIPRDW